MPPRLLILVNAFEADAPTRLMLEVARAAQASGRFECHMAAVSRGGPLEKKAAAVAAEAHNLALGPVRSLVARSQITGLIRRLAPRLVHVSLLRPTVLGVTAARRAGVPAIAVTCHGTHEWGEARPLPEWLVRRIYLRAVRTADAVVGVSEAVRRDLVAAGLRDNLTRSIPNGVDAVRYAPDESPAPGRSSSPLQVGAAGNLRPVKGLDLLVEAAGLLKTRLDDGTRFQFRIWGEGPERPRLEHQIGELGLKEIVRLEGHCGNMDEALGRCAVFVQPSRREAFGLAAAEAMACGVPVVGARTGGLPELIGEGEDAGGLLFANGSVPELAEALKRLLEDPVLRRQLSENARRRVLAHFTLARMTEGYMNLYDELLTRTATR